MDLFDRLCPLCLEKIAYHVVREAHVDITALDEFSFSSRKLPEYMHFRLVQCCACSCVFASPAPGASQLAQLYKEAAFSSSEEGAYAARTYADLIERMAARFDVTMSKETKVLDIGTGDGAFLYELQRRGFSALHGIEPSRAPIQKAPAVIRDCIHNEIFSAESFGDMRFDVITLFQTIEHVDHPREVFEIIRSKLSTGGIFCVVCHNYAAFSRKLLQFRSPIFDIEHLQLFQPDSLRKLFERAGFINIAIEPIWNTYPLHYWCKLLPFPVTTKRWILSHLQGKIGRTLIKIPAGNIIATGMRGV